MQQLPYVPVAYLQSNGMMGGPNYAMMQMHMQHVPYAAYGCGQAQNVYPGMYYPPVCPPYGATSGNHAAAYGGHGEGKDYAWGEAYDCNSFSSDKTGFSWADTSRSWSGSSNASDNHGGRRNGHGRMSIPATVKEVSSRGSAKQRKQPQKGMEDQSRRTVYVSSIDVKVTEAGLAEFFSDCGKVVDCRICGDLNSATRFAFIEFKTMEAVQQALTRNGVKLGRLPLRVLRSKTAIVPVSREFVPSSNEELERCARTVYVGNIDKEMDAGDVCSFFEDLCGEVSRLRLLGDRVHPTRVAFIEFALAEAAMAALNCTGAVLGSLPIRVAPSKTPVRAEPKEGDSADKAGSSAEPGSTADKAGGSAEPGSGADKAGGSAEAGSGAAVPETAGGEQAAGQVASSSTQQQAEGQGTGAGAGSGHDGGDALPAACCSEVAAEACNGHVDSVSGDSVSGEAGKGSRHDRQELAAAAGESDNVLA